MDTCKGEKNSWNYDDAVIVLPSGRQRGPAHPDRTDLIGSLIDMVEDWLEKKTIVIFNPEKDKDFNAANIYGSDYDALASAFESTLVNYGILEKTGA